MVKYNDEDIAEFICEGGSGSEARVKVELRTRFSGIGGTIVTQEGALTALREEFNPALKSGHKMFLKHTIIKKLEDYFYRIGIYNFAHIPRPLGSISSIEGERPYEAYLYEWAYGGEGFPWEEMDNNLEIHPIILKDWGEFVGSFNNAGINMQYDVTDPDDGRISKNIIHQFPRVVSTNSELSSIWKKIDFGYKSTPIDYDKLSKFLHDKSEEIHNVLRYERYHMLLLAVEYLTKEREEMKKEDIGRLEELIRDYRLATLRHYTSRGLGITATVPYSKEGGAESLL